MKEAREARDREAGSSRSSTYSYGIKVGVPWRKRKGESERQGKGEPLEEEGARPDYS